ncbi:MAG: hypothetical protein ABIP14_05260 [Blastocatellia bacterium]
MGIFQAIPTDRCGDTIRAAQKEIINRANENHLTTEGWSLAELRLDDSDVEWLHTWAHALDEDTTNRWISPGHTAAFWGNPQTRRVGIGILMMLLAAEQIRRYTGPTDTGEWNWLVNFAASFNERTRVMLFKDEGLSGPLVGSLREASQRLRLRLNSDWGTPESQAENLALQVGLLETDLPERFPMWLKGDDVPEHICVLLDPINGSDSFLHLWQTCCEFLQGYREEAELRDTLETSVWILPRWIDEIVKTLQAHRKPEAESEAIPSRPATGALTPLSHEPEDVFGAFMPYGGAKTIIRATCAMLNRADKRCLRSQASQSGQPGQPPQLWTPTDLQISDYDYAWLRVWATRLEPETIAHIAETERQFEAGESHISLRAALGSLLALWIAETARRGENGDDELWAFIASNGFKPAVAAELFRENQPSSFLRVLLTAAARELNMRETLNTAGML